MSDKETLIQLVTENDEPIRGGTMDEAQLEGYWHRIARVMVYDYTSKRFLLQKIKPNPYYNGGQWNTTSSGHVDEGEEYIDAAVRETKEEMGIELTDLQEIDRYTTQTTKQRAGRERNYRRHNVTFLVKIAANEVTVQPNESEVEEIAWLSMVELAELRDNEPTKITDGLTRFVDQQRENTQWL